MWRDGCFRPIYRVHPDFPFARIAIRLFVELPDHDPPTAEIGTAIEDRAWGHIGESVQPELKLLPSPHRYWPVISCNSFRLAKRLSQQVLEKRVLRQQVRARIFGAEA